MLVCCTCDVYFTFFRMMGCVMKSTLTESVTLVALCYISYN
jgi:hypothetical protein